MVSRALILVVPSALDKLLNATTTLGSVIEDRSGNSATYDKVLRFEVVPNPPNGFPETARLLDACVLNCRLLMLNPAACLRIIVVGYVY
jgi:hypothetical protein